MARERSIFGSVKVSVNASANTLVTTAESINLGVQFIKEELQTVLTENRATNALESRANIIDSYTARLEDLAKSLDEAKALPESAVKAIKIKVFERELNKVMDLMEQFN